MEKEIKYYTNSKNEKLKISDIHTEHLTNAIAKKYREVYEAKTKKEFNEKLIIVNDLKEELYNRYNSFYETLGDE